MDQASFEPAVVAAEPSSPLLTEILVLARREKKWLGFLPDEGFRDRAARGTLFAASSDQRVLGYVLFDLPRDQVRIVHLCVDPAHRGSGIARRLVDEVRKEHRDRRGVYLECRSDYGLHGMWRSLGFTPVGERPGRGIERKPLTVWSLEHGHPDLFSSWLEADDRELAAVDHNILIDLTDPRVQGAQSPALLEDWVTELVELCATDEVYHEVADSQDASQRGRMRSRLSYLSRLSPQPEQWEPLCDAITPLIPEAEIRDVCHLARAVAAGASYFITRDGCVLEGGDGLLRDLGIHVLRPEQLISRLDRLRAQERYEPSALQATDIDSVPAAETDEGEIVQLFLNYGEGEKRGAFLRIFRAALAAPGEQFARVFRDGSERLLALEVRSETSEGIEVQVLRASASDPVGGAVARQLVFAQRSRAAELGAERVIISDPHPSHAITRALPEEGFDRETDGRWTCRVRRGISPASEALNRELGNSDIRDEAVAVERANWPLKIVGACIPVYMVPIRPRWAEELFETRLAERILWGRDTALGLAREHVYYRRPRNDRGIAAPARILWYVSAEPKVHPEAHVRAVSLLAEVAVGPASRLFKRFARLGVYTEGQVRAAANEAGNVMALRFVHTELLHEPLSLSKLRDLWRSAGKRFVAPASPQVVDELLFERLYEQGSSYVR